MCSDRTDSLEATLNEVRREYTLKVERLDETDDKVLRISRTSVLVVGFAASAVTVGGSDAVESVPMIYLLILSLGLTSTLVAAVLGIAKVTVTTYPIGVGSSQRNEIRDLSYSHASTLSEYIDQYEGMVSEVTRELRRNKRWLSIVQYLTIFGSTALFTGSSSYITLEILSSSEYFSSLPNISIYLSLATPIILILVTLVIAKRVNKVAGEAEHQ